jgi:hypothetical protein
MTQGLGTVFGSLPIFQRSFSAFGYPIVTGVAADQMPHDSQLPIKLNDGSGQNLRSSHFALGR